MNVIITRGLPQNANDQTTMPLCNLCQAGHASSCTLANRESEQAAPRDALVFGCWQCNTYTAICNILSDSPSRA